MAEPQELVAVLVLLIVAVLTSGIAGRARPGPTALERARLAEEVNAARAAAETERVRNTLLVSVSHDFRTPLASILGAATSLIDYGGLLPESARDLLRPGEGRRRAPRRHVRKRSAGPLNTKSDKGAPVLDEPVPSGALRSHAPKGPLAMRCPPVSSESSSMRRRDSMFVEPGVFYRFEPTVPPPPVPIVVDVSRSGQEHLPDRAAIRRVVLKSRRPGKLHAGGRRDRPRSLPHERRRVRAGNGPRLLGRHGSGDRQAEREALKQELKAAGYDGERVVVLGAADRAAMKAMGDVAADMLQQIGMNVDYQIADWGTVNARSGFLDDRSRHGANDAIARRVFKAEPF